MSTEFWNWKPGVAVGPFRIGSNASDVIDQHGLRKLEPDCRGAFWDTYRIPGTNSSITVEEDKISSVACWDHLWFRGNDIICLDMHGVNSVLGPFSQTEDHPYVKGTQVFYYRALGLTLFVSDGKVESATCDEIESGE